ncbi:histidine kinase [Algoriphagus yeomjeoni]|uniref:histidine kinase n=1 Tax=Algoriphagus yeomjeoni TaxID=291403 RepID=UPI003CE4BBE9
MESRFYQIFTDWYLIAISFLLIVGIFYFLKLPKHLKADKFFWFPFLILAFTVLYENMGGYLKYNFEFNKLVNAALGNVENPTYNVWLFNIGYYQIGTILYLFLIKNWLVPSKKKYINWLVFVFIVLVIAIQLLGIEPIYTNQPIIFAIGANMILVGSGLYFIGLITEDNYLNSNPFKLLSFWQMTFILFTYSLTYINSVALLYLWNINKELAISLMQINRVLGVINLSILVLWVASPSLTKIFEIEPYSHGSI